MKIFAIVSIVLVIRLYGYDQQNTLNIERLNKHFNLLNQFNTKNKKEYLISWASQTTVPFFYDCDVHCGSYEHPLIILCLKKMKTAGTIEPLFETWALFLQNYKDVDGSLFLKEISRILFCLYKNILLTLDAQAAQRVSVLEVVTLYNKITTLPIDEVIVALEHCYIRLAFVLKEYEFFSAMSWSEWLVKYWWVPPVIILSVAWKILLYKIASHLANPITHPSLPESEYSLDFDAYLLG